MQNACGIAKGAEGDGAAPASLDDSKRKTVKAKGRIMTKHKHRRPFVVVFSGLLLASISLAEEWPKFLGPDGTGVSHEKNLLAQWPAVGPAKAWSATVGEGYASPTGATKDWENDQVQSQFQTPILDGDHLYANSAGVLTCIHWPDGKRRVWAVPLLYEGKLYCKGKDQLFCLNVGAQQ
jgi:hypothetical protein